MNCFNPYIFQPEKKDVSNTGSSSKSESEVTNLDWCTCGNCKNEKREIDCLFCQEVDGLKGIFHNEQIKGAVMLEEFKSLCLNKVVLKNVLKRSFLKIIFRIDP